MSFEKLFIKKKIIKSFEFLFFKSEYKISVYSTTEF